MTDDKDTEELVDGIDSRKDLLEKLGHLAVGSVGSGTVDPVQSSTIGTPDQGISEVHCSDRLLAWLDNSLEDGGKMYSETVFFETETAEYSIRAENDTIVVEKQEKDQ